MSEIDPKLNQPLLPNRRSDIVARVAWGAMAGGGLIGIVFGACRLLRALSPADITVLLNQHGPALIGVPVTMSAATILVGVARAIDGPLKLDLLGISVEGASASVVLWIGAVLAIAFSIRILW